MIDLGFIGNVVNDASVRTTPNGVDVCSFTVAVNDRYDKNKPATFFRVSAWRKLAETSGRYVRKGMKVYVHCDEIKANIYQSNGENRVSIEVTAKDVEFLSRVDGDAQQNSTPQAEQYNESEPTPEVPQGYTSVEVDSLPF